MSFAATTAPSLRNDSRMKLYLPSRAQFHLWKIEQIAGTKSKPNEVLCLHIPDDPTLGHVVAVLRDMVRERYQYHSTLVPVDGSPFWGVGDAADVKVQEVRLGQNDQALDGLDGATDGAELPEYIHRMYQSERLHAFDLEREFPLRISIARHGETGPGCLFITLHPMVASRSLPDSIFRRLGGETICGGPALTALPGSLESSSYTGDATGSGSKMSEMRETHETPALQDMPTDRPRNAAKRFASVRHEFAFTSEQSSALRDFFAAACVPEELGLFVLFAVVAGRYIQQPTIRVGFSCHKTGEQPVLHPDSLLDHAMVEVATHQDATFADLAAILHRGLNLATASPPASLDSFVGNRDLAVAMSYSPYCQIAFDFQEQGGQSFQLDHADNVDKVPVRRLHPHEPERSFSHSELELKVQRTNAGKLVCAMEYSSALFDAATIQGFVCHYQNLAAAILLRPDAMLGDLDLMDATERQILAGAGDECFALPAKTLDELFAEQAWQTPNAIALIENGRQLSYSRLDAMSQQIATQLRADGIEPGDRVGVFLPRSMEVVACVLGILRCGAVYVPLDMQLSMERARAVEADGKLKSVLHASADIAFAGWRNITTLSLWQEQEPATFDAPAVQHRITDAAYLIYTSGSTGNPKGVIGSHLSIVNRVLWGKNVLALDDDDIFCLKTGFALVDHVAEIFQPLLCGKPLVIVGDAVLHDTTALIAQLSEEHVTRITVMPSLLYSLLDHPQIARLGLLKSVVCSGETLTQNLAQRFFKSLPRARLINIYGLTEAGADCSFHEVAYDPKFDLPAFFLTSQDVPLSLPLPIQGSGSGSRSLAPAKQHRITYPGLSLDDIKAGFVDSVFPESPRSVKEYSAWLSEKVLPYIVNVSSGKFIGHMTSALPDFMPEVSALISKLNQNMVKIETSKALTFLERQLLATLHREFFAGENYDGRIQNPDDIFGLVVSGGSSANVTAMWNARNRALLSLGYSKADISYYGAAELFRKKGYEGFAIVASGLAHYSMRKAASLLGIGERNLLTIKRDSRQKADLADLQATLEQCREKRIFVIAIIGIAGATETGTIDPIADMAGVAAKNNIHFHVDAAWGGPIVFSAKYKPLLNGIERADSVTLCPHKQLYVPQGMSICLFKNPRAIHASSVQAVYQGKQGSFDMGQYTIEGSRSAIFLSLHAMFNIVTKRGIGALVEQGIEKTRYFAGLVSGNRAFELIGFPEINILNYRYIPRHLRSKNRFSVEENRQISEATAIIQEQQFIEGRTFVSKTDILSNNHGPDKITVFRVVISNPMTTREDLRDILDNQLKIADAIIEDSAHAETRNQLFGGGFLPGGQPGDSNAYGVPIGRAIANVEILLLDAQWRMVPVGVVGEIFVGGVGLALGYAAPGEMADAFVPHPFRPGANLVRTGDFGRRLANGEILFCGRKDRQVKIGGMRVELGNIEANLLGQDGVVQCAVFAEAEGAHTRLVGFVVPAGGSPAELNERALRRKLIVSLPSYSVPEFLYVIDALPLTTSGKIDLASLRRFHRERLVPSSGSADSTSQANNATETKLLEICESVLVKKHIRTSDDFFGIGGNFLNAASLRSRIKSEFQVELSFQALFEYPRIDDIADMIDDALYRAAAQRNIPNGVHGVETVAG